MTQYDDLQNNSKIRLDINGGELEKKEYIDGEWVLTDSTEWNDTEWPPFETLIAFGRKIKNIEAIHFSELNLFLILGDAPLRGETLTSPVLILVDDSDLNVLWAETVSEIIHVDEISEVSIDNLLTLPIHEHSILLLQFKATIHVILISKASGVSCLDNLHS